MKLITTPLSKKELLEMAEQGFGTFVKAVIDVDKEIMMVDANLHSDEEASLLSLGSKQSNLWGINLYPELEGDDFIEFDSMINLRPGQGNLSRSVDTVDLQKIIRDIVAKLIV